MPVGINEKGRKFIETEPIGKDGEHCEQKLWDACKKLLPSANVLVIGDIQFFLKLEKVGKSLTYSS